MPVSFFFDGAPTGDMPSGGFSDEASIAYVSDFMAASEGVQLNRAFSRVNSGSARRRIIDMIEALAEPSDEDAA